MSAIGPENIISKLTFALLGEVTPRAEKELRKRLNRFSREQGDMGFSPPSRQSISAWFKGSIPKSAIALQFLANFCEKIRIDSETYDKLTSTQKKVLGQIIADMRRRKQRAVNSQIIHGVSKGSIVFHQQRIFNRDEYAVWMRDLDGYYNSYRLRFARTDSKKISRECLRLRRVGAHLYVTWWYLINDRRLERFDGVAFFVNDAIWIQAYAPASFGRIRNFVSRRSEWPMEDYEISSGHIMSTRPSPDTGEPITRRTVLERITSPNLKNSIRDYVQHVEEEDIPVHVLEMLKS